MNWMFGNNWPSSMMGGWGLGLLGFWGWLWVIIWTVNSVLLGWLLWVLIKKHSKK